MDNSESNFSKEWDFCNPAQKLGLLEKTKKSFESKDFRLFNEITSRYGDLLDHDNPNIAHVALDLLEISVNEFGWNEELKSITIVTTLLTQTLQRKERKPAATQLLLLLAETSQKALQNAIQVSLNSKFPKQLLEVLRFLQILVISTDENKKQMLKELSHAIFEVAAEFSLASVRQAAVDLIIKMAVDLGVDFIRPNLSVLKKSQRVQIAKRLNESGIADGEIDTFEQKKAYWLKCHQEQQQLQKEKQGNNNNNNINTDRSYPLSYKVAAEMIKSKNENEKIGNKNAVLLDTQAHKHNIFHNNTVLFVEQLQETTAKDKITLISQIHEKFKNNSNNSSNSEIEWCQLMQYWEFAKYLQFANPQAQQQLMEILEEYIKLMDESAEKKQHLWKVLSGQMKQIFTQIIRNLAISQRYLIGKSQELTVSFLNDLRWREAILESISQELLSKSEGILLALLRLLSLTLFTKDIDRNVLNLPMAKQIIEKIVGLVTTACESVRKLAFSTLITAAVPMGMDIFVFADKLPPAQLSRFQEQTASIWQGNASGEEGNAREIQEGTSNPLNERIEAIKLRICHGNIINQEQLVLELSGCLEEESKLIEEGEHAATVKILTSLIEAGGENIANNAVILCGMISSKMSSSDRFLTFQYIFRSYEALRQKEAIQNLNILFNKIDGDIIFPYLLSSIAQRVYENTGFTFLSSVMEKLDGEQNLAFAVQAVRMLITDTSIATKVLATDFLAKTWLIKGKDMIEQAVNSQIEEEKQRDMIVNKIEKSYKKFNFLEKIKKNQQSSTDEAIAEKEGIRKQGLSNSRAQQKQVISLKEFKMENKKRQFDNTNKESNNNDSEEKGNDIAATNRGQQSQQKSDMDQEDHDEI